MDLYVIRHAEAVDLGENGILDDADRHLTERGRRQAAVLAEALPKRDVQVELVVTSPLVRARQTAEGMLAGWPTPHPQLRVSELLAPGFKRKSLAKFLRELGVQRAALVGHMPDLAEFTAWLMGGRQAQLDFAKAGVAYLRCDKHLDKGSATLEWLVTPAWC